MTVERVNVLFSNSTTTCRSRYTDIEDGEFGGNGEGGTDEYEGEGADGGSDFGKAPDGKNICSDFSGAVNWIWNGIGSVTENV